MHTAKIFQPIQVGSMTVRNRIVMPPMSTRLSNTDGSVTPRLLDYYETRAKGGVGAIIVEYSYIDEEASKAAVCQLGVYSDNLLPGLSELAEVIKFHGAKALMQLCHGGGQSPSYLIKQSPLAPSAIPSKSGEFAKELNIQQIKKIVNSFGEAALRVKKAGFDGVEIHGAHGYLINQFLSPRFNKRTDAYGPNFNARVRFPLEIVHEIRKKVGKKFTVGFRLNVDDYLVDGITLEESKQFVKMLEEAGIDYIHASAGTYESHQFMISPSYLKRGHLADLAREMKQVVSIPVISVGGINHEVGPQIIENGDANLVAMGRALVADPDLPNKLKDGRLEEVRPCIRCNDGCIGRFFQGKTMRCATNPATGRESSFSMDPARESKKIVIVGAGVAGMEFARIAKQKGHEVAIFERNSNVGGNAAIAAVPKFKQDVKNLIAWYKHQIQSLNIDLRLSQDARLGDIQRLEPDILVLATGSEHFIPKIQKINSRKVVTASDVLTGKAKAKGKVAIIGGGLVGVETALYLAKEEPGSIQGITILEMMEEIAFDVVSVNKLEIKRQIKEEDIKIITSAKVTSITESGLEYSDEDQKTIAVDADAIILAVGFVAREGLAADFRDAAPAVYVIGDSKKPGKIIDAINEAAELAINL
ncbi:NAD(P)/FAD-dependent oxidoreductase [Paradesulfitobacterium ferrireducens]|uniref:NAD(P)/FAD-dependent oxidoreductase n=1 Tax=Paradesulfitobacterium ferrireducens TaxID=2816476 RepID=UPI001A8C13F5|nr:NAD(P)/FAD-dependent oxidoreductase [Paradesulfitobacterium ferrireducens]